MNVTWDGRIVSFIICDHLTFKKTLGTTLFLNLQEGQTVVLKMHNKKHHICYISFSLYRSFSQEEIENTSDTAWLIGLIGNG